MKLLRHYSELVATIHLLYDIELITDKGATELLRRAAGEVFGTLQKRHSLKALYRHRVQIVAILQRTRQRSVLH